MRRLPLLIAILALALLATASAASASIWTPLASGTTQDITAIDYHSDTQLWFATSGGQIFYANGAGFTAATVTPGGTPFTDIKFDAAGMHGYAVGSNGLAYYSKDAGQTWTTVGPLNGHATCDSTSTTGAQALYTIAWAGPSTVYIAGGASSDSSAPVVFVSTNANSATTPMFNEKNVPGGTTCAIGAGGDYITDSAVAASNTNLVTFLNNDFGGVWRTTGAATPFSAMGGFTKTGELVNSFSSLPRLAMDPANTNRLWAIDHGAGCDILCFQYSDSGGAGNTELNIPNKPTGDAESLWGVAFNGGTLVAAGDNGLIYTSVDGHTAYFQPADGALATTNWRAVGIDSATTAIVGGTGGALVKTTLANTIPDLVPPTGSISGPDVVHAGVPTTYTAVVADNAGGSGINPASLQWTSSGLTGQTGATATFTFPAAGNYTLNLAYADNANNAGVPATKQVEVEPAVHVSPTKTTSSTSNGATVSLSAPNTCVPAGSSFKVTLAFKHVNKKVKKGTVVFVRVIKTTFYIGSKKVKTVKKAPFVARLTVKAGTKSKTKITVKAQAEMKVKHPKHGKYPTKSIHTTVTVC